MALTHSPKIVIDDLQLCWDAANSKSYPGSGTWNDISGKGQNGTITSAAYSSDNGGIFDFDGSGDYVSYNDQSPYPLRNWWDQAWTVEYWMKADAFGQSANGGSNVVGVTNLSTTGEVWSFGPVSYTHLTLPTKRIV